jgi:hypothetical protein
MPVTIRKKDGYEVRTPHGVKAKRTTKEKAKAQERLLNAIEHNPDFKPRKNWLQKHKSQRKKEK